MIAAKAGATFVSPFLGRLDDLSQRGMDLIEEIVDIFAVSGLDTEIIAASVRHPLHVKEIAMTGCDIATIPPAVFRKMIEHPMTDLGIDRFLEDWESVPKKEGK